MSYSLRNKNSPSQELCCKCNKGGAADSLLCCSTCRKFYHKKSPCYKLDGNIWENCKSYPWSCLECKCCEVCKSRRDDANLILCDECDRGYHLYCLSNALKKPPQGKWKCPICESVAGEGSSKQATATPSVRKTRLLSSITEASASGDERGQHIKKVKVTLLPAETAKRSSIDALSSITKKRKSLPESEKKERTLLPHRELRDSRRHLPTVSRSSTPIQSLPASRKPEANNHQMQLNVELPPLPRSCPTPDCNSRGHLSGAYETHRTLDTCPLYHNSTDSDCKRMLQERQQLFALSKATQAQRPLRTTPKDSQSACVAEIQEKRLKVRQSLMSPEKRLKSERCAKHYEDYGRERQPLLEGFSTDEDLELFRQSQALLAHDLEEHQEMLYTRHDSFVKVVEFGDYEIQSCYPSPYPDGMEKLHKLFICEFCLKYLSSATILRRHKEKCVWMHPPGNEIYRKGNLSIFEVDGRKWKVYCQNLCLFAKLFLDHKTLYFDVEPFLFYVLTVVDDAGCHIVGYFSKEKKSCMNCNLSCILILPPYQHMGYGRLLIDFSYLLSRIEEKIGSPERPLSDLGLVSYRKYWTDVILTKAAKMQGSVSIKDLSQDTGIHPNDIVSTLEFLGMVKYWKGEYYIYKREELLQEYLTGAKLKYRLSQPQIDPSCLHWTKPSETEK